MLSENTISALRPIVRAIGAVIKALYTLLFGWLDWLMQKRANNRLANDVLASLYFLSPEPVRMKERSKALPFDCAEAKVLYENICFVFTRGRGEVSVSLAPRHDIRDSHPLANILPALESRPMSELDMTATLSNAIGLIRPRISALNEAFSPEHYRQFKKKL